MSAMPSSLAVAAHTLAPAPAKTESARLMQDESLSWGEASLSGAAASSSPPSLPTPPWPPSGEPLSGHWVAPGAFHRRRSPPPHRDSGS